MNQITLRGRLTDVPQIRYKQDGASVASFALAVPDRMAGKDKDGNFPCDFIRCVAFNKEAEVLECYAVKGTEILVMGKIKSGSFVKDDVKHFTTEVQIICFEFLSGTKPKEENDSDKKTK